MPVKTSPFILICVALVLAVPSEVQAFEWLRSANDNVEEGNAKLAKKDPKGALEAYDKAARELPSNPGVHLNRGLALLKQSDLPAARQALLLATEPAASPKDDSAAVRADAYYNLGLAFYKEAEQKAAENNHEEAQKLFREAADSLRRSLMIRPGNRDAAWNLELAQRRIREEEKKQKEQQEQQEEKQKEGDGQEQDKKQDDQQEQDKGQQQGSEGDKGQQKQDPKQQQPKPEDQQKQADKDQRSSQSDKSDKKQPEPETGPQPLPSDVAKALDALQDSEDNLERLRARQRAERERRLPEKDW